MPPAVWPAVSRHSCGGLPGSLRRADAPEEIAIAIAIADSLAGHIVRTTQADRQHECLLTAGQTAGGIDEILSVGEIMRRLIAETEAALSRAPDLGETASQRARWAQRECKRRRLPLVALKRPTVAPAEVPLTEALLKHAHGAPDRRP